MRTLARLLINLGLTVPFVWTIVVMTKSLVLASEGSDPTIVETMSTKGFESILFVTEVGLFSVLIGIVLLRFAPRRDRNQLES